MNTAVDEGVEPAIQARVASCDWARISTALDAQGWSVLERLFTPLQCQEIASLYDRDERFRKRVVMAQHGYGQGEYKYFSYPLPGVVEALRTSLYPRLAAIANQWVEALRMDVSYPLTHAAYLARCHQAGQTRATPLILKYEQGDYNRLHQDLYGAQVFPLQVAILLSLPGEDFAGGEFVLTEQRPRKQSRACVVPLGQGDAVVFAVNHRPERGARGYHRVMLRHGVSTVHSGRRFTLGIIFHDAA